MSFRSIMDSIQRDIDNLQVTVLAKGLFNPKGWNTYPKEEGLRSKEKACTKKTKCIFFSMEKGVTSIKGEFFGDSKKNYTQEKTVYCCNLGQFPLTDNTNLIPFKCPVRKWGTDTLKRFKRKQEKEHASTVG